MPIPLLILSDAPSAPTGLGRITRDLATRIASYLPDVFRVGTLGYGGAGSRTLPFQQYAMEGLDTNWYVPTLPDVWADFAGEEKGILLTIWDASRLGWLARPKLPHIQQLRQKFDLWGYFPIDAAGPNDRLSVIQAANMAGFNRVLCYSEWASNLVSNTTGKTTDWLPHGLDTSIWYPRPKEEARARLLQADKNLNVSIVGMVATNQARKDFGLAFQALAEVAATRELRVWVQTDKLERHWSIPNLLYDYGLADKCIFSVDIDTDEEMAWRYSACDVTLGIGMSEGFGFPIFESIACGTPAIHVNCGGAAEWMDSRYLIEPVEYRLEGLHNSVRPVCDPIEWAAKIVELLELRPPVGLPRALDWNQGWPKWAAWLKAGVEELCTK